MYSYTWLWTKKILFFFILFWKLCTRGIRTCWSFSCSSSSLLPIVSVNLCLLPQQIVIEGFVYRLSVKSWDMVSLTIAFNHSLSKKKNHLGNFSNWLEANNWKPPSCKRNNSHCQYKNDIPNYLFIVCSHFHLTMWWQSQNYNIKEKTQILLQLLTR